MNAVLYDIALTAYIAATATALAALASRRESIGRATLPITAGGWLCHTLAIVVRGIELGRPPLGTVAEMVSVGIWAAVLLELGLEWRSGLRVLGAFMLPVILVLGLALPTGLRALALEPRIRSVWIWAHVALALVGLAALLLNFAGAVMYVLQERQLKAKHPGRLYYALPSLETLDRLTSRALTLGFPFLTASLLLGALGAGPAWGWALPADPLVALSLVAWLVYAATLSGRVIGGWSGRRAAYFAIAGFCALLLTFGVGMILQGHQGL
jgi:ABC-type transport system involved in cytochrome c biogenesis permease subunit